METKRMIYEAMEEAPSDEVANEREVMHYFANFDETFFTHTKKELEKVNTFFSDKRQLRKRQTLNIIKLDREAHKTVQNHSRKLQDLKLAYSEFYLSLIIIQNYQTLNYTGFRKILKKHDKLFKKDNGAKWMSNFVDTSQFHTNKEIDKLIQETEVQVSGPVLFAILHYLG
ncbi:Xenotropic and polytropic retrovirus receptor 1 [Nymphon striatum]|nr:Xenotropic and polytropic retrovirus receptor 1 [Nymphon striatum]